MLYNVFILAFIFLWMYLYVQSIKRTFPVNLHFFFKLNTFKINVFLLFITHSKVPPPLRYATGSNLFILIKLLKLFKKFDIFFFYMLYKCSKKNIFLKIISNSKMYRFKKEKKNQKITIR